MGILSRIFGNLFSPDENEQMDIPIFVEESMTPMGIEIRKLDELYQRVDFRSPFAVKTKCTAYDDEKTINICIELDIQEESGMLGQLRSDIRVPAEKFFVEAPNERMKLRFLRWCLQRVALHEVDECILMNGRKIFDPHVEQDVPDEDFFYKNSNGKLVNF